MIVGHPFKTNFLKGFCLIIDELILLPSRIYLRYTHIYMQEIPSHFSVEKLHPITRILLENRGVVCVQEIYDFLFPSYELHIGDPFAIHGMKEAVGRIIQAFKKEEKIAVYSDYDCDGIPGGVLLRTFFDDIGYPVEMYIPHRHNEGYGVHKHAVDILKEKGVTLVITVDLAITNIEEIAYAKSVGVDFIVTDHHLPLTVERSSKQKAKSKKENTKEGEEKTGHDAEGVVQVVPDAVAVINSKQDVCTYHDDMLCGCAVAWKLSCAILSTLRVDKIAQESFHEANGNKQIAKKGNTSNTKKYMEMLEKVAALPDGFEKWMLDLVGISTIADMVPLVNENRALAHFGLKVLRKTKRPGLLHILTEQRMKKEFLLEDDIAFTIAPRINAASRMGDPVQAHNMLYEKDIEKAEQYARDLEDLNTERKQGVKDIVSTLSFDNAVYANDVIVVGDMSWGPGILGLIAQNIIDETGKPVFVWGQGDDTTQVKGSCRSRGDVHVVDLMAHVGHSVFTHWGGHEGAGGFSVAVADVDKISDALNESYKYIEKKEIGEKGFKVDVVISIDDINDTTYNAVAILSPFGIGNAKPVFEIKDSTALSTKWFGKKGEHFEVLYRTSRGGSIKAIQFFAPKDIEEKVKKEHRARIHLERSYFGGRVELRMRIVEVG